MDHGQRDRQTETNEATSEVTGGEVSELGNGGEASGGVYVAGHVTVGRDIVGRDQYNYGLTPEQVAALVVELKRVDQPAVWDGRIPYLGLRPFREADAQFFFGRENLVAELLERVQKSSFLAIAGPSGSGKSSVARAGLLHALRQGRLERSESWLLATMTPRGNPLEELAQAVERATRVTAAGDALRTAEPDNADSLLRQVRVHLSDDPRQRFLLLVDQFEEIFTQTQDPAVQAAFIDLLTATVQTPDSRCIILLSVRSDFISHCARFPALRALISQNFQLVGAMAPAGLAKAITLPALEVGAEIDPALVSRIMADMKGEPGALPLMSFALRDLFEAEKTAPGKPVDLTLAEYLDRGGIERALERHADGVFRTFSQAQKDLARRVFSRLIEVGQGRVDTRRTATFAELVPAGVTAEEVAEVVRALARERVRLLTTGGVQEGGELSDVTEDAATVTIAHEKLIEAWPWLRRLVDENRELIALQNQIARDAAAWQAAGREPGFLYRGGRLLQVEEKLASQQAVLDELSRAFVEAAIAGREKEVAATEARRQRELAQERALAAEQRKRAEEAEIAATGLRRRRNIAFGLAAGAILAALVALLFFGQAQRENSRAEANAAVAETRAAEVAVQATTAARNLSRALAGEAQAAAQATAAFASAQQALASANLAATREAEALRQAELAFARQLIAESSTVRGATIDLHYRSTLLAVEAARRLASLGLPSLQADLALRPNLQLMPRVVGTTGCRPGGAATFRAGGQQLVQACRYSGYIWDAGAREQVAEIGAAGERKQAVSPDGRFALVAYDYGGDDGRASVIDLDSGEAIQRVEYDGPGIEFALSAGAAYLAIHNAYDDLTQIWDVAAGESLLQMVEEEPVLALLFTPERARLLVARESGIRLADLLAWEEGDDLAAAPLFAEGCFDELVFTPDGRYLAAHACPRAGATRAVTIWDFPSGDVVQRVEGIRVADQFAVSADRRYLAYVSRTTYTDPVVLVDIANDRHLQLSEFFDPPPVAFSPSDDLLAAGHQIWEIAEFTSLAQFESGDDILAVAFEPDEAGLVVLGGEAGEDGSGTGGDRPFSLYSLTLDSTASGGLRLLAEDSAIAAQVAGAGSSLALRDNDGNVQIFAGSRLAQTYEVDESAPRDLLALSPDGERLVLAGEGQVEIREARSAQPVASGAYEGTAQAAIFPNPDQVYLVTYQTYCENCGTRGHRETWLTRVWAFPGGEELFRHETVNIGEAVAPYVVLAPGGSYWGERGPQGQNVKVIDLASGHDVGTFAHPEGQISRFALNGDGRFLATLGADGAVRVWNTTTRTEFARVQSEAALDSFYLSPSGRYLVTVSGGSLRVWLLQLADLVAEACARLPRNLTWEEWDAHMGDARYAATCPNLELPVAEMLAAGQAYAARGQREEAIDVYEELAAIALARSGPYPASALCWEATLSGLAELALPACERAVALNPDSRSYRENRAVARAYLGDYQGAIDDLEVYVELAESSGITTLQWFARIDKRREWISVLRAGQNPFDEAVLAELASER